MDMPPIEIDDCLLAPQPPLPPCTTPLFFLSLQLKSAIIESLYIYVLLAF